MKVFMKNQFGAMKQVKVGFSWTMLFFGFLVPLIRGDWKWTIVMLLITFISYGVAQIIVPFFYNKMYINDLIEKGWVPADETAANAFNGCSCSKQFSCPTRYYIIK